MDRVTTLQKLSLSPSEAKTYLAVLDAGELRVAEVAKIIGHTKMAGYLAVRALIEKGLLGEVTKGGHKYVVAEDPDRLLLRLKEEKNRLEQQESNLGQLLPELEVLYHSAKVKPGVRVYEGLEGLKTVYEDTLKTLKPGDSFVAFGSADVAFAHLRVYLVDYIARRVKKRISFRGIAPADKVSREYLAKNTAELREVRLVSAKRFPFKNEIDIYANKVAILSFQDQIGVIVESKQIADTQRAIFDLAWLGAVAAK